MGKHAVSGIGLKAKRERRKQIAKLCRTLPPDVIASQFRVTTETVKVIAKLHGIKPLKVTAGNRRRAERYAAARAPKVARIAAMRQRGMTLDAIGQQLGLTRERVRQLLKFAEATP